MYVRVFVCVLDRSLVLWQPLPLAPPPSPSSPVPLLRQMMIGWCGCGPSPPVRGGSPSNALLLSVDKAAASFPVQPWEPQVSTHFYRTKAFLLCVCNLLCTVHHRAHLPLSVNTCLLSARAVLLVLSAVRAAFCALSVTDCVCVCLCASQSISIQIY